MFNKHSIKKIRTLPHALKLFLTGKRKLHEVTRQPRSLCSFTFRKAWIGGQESALEKDKKRALGAEGNNFFFLCYQPNRHKGFTFTTTRCSFQLTQCEKKFEDYELYSMQMQVCK